MKILIVEDEKRTAQNLERFIRGAFQPTMEAFVCESAEAALQFLRKREVNLVMTDICMPGMDGLALIRHIHTLYPQMRIVVLSAYGDFSYVREAFLLGVVDYILKPLDRVEFANVLVRCGMERERENAPEETDAKKRIIDRIKRTVDENIGKTISLSGLAESVDMNPQYLSSLFKESTGENLFSYVTRKRIERAQVLLKQSSLKIYEIAEIAGYSDTKYFSYVFKKLTGMTPGECRDTADSFGET